MKAMPVSQLLPYITAPYSRPVSVSGVNYHRRLERRVRHGRRLGHHGLLRDGQDADQPEDHEHGLLAGHPRQRGHRRARDAARQQRIQRGRGPGHRQGRGPQSGPDPGRARRPGGLVQLLRGRTPPGAPSSASSRPGTTGDDRRRPVLRRLGRQRRPRRGRDLDGRADDLVWPVRDGPAGHHQRPVPDKGRKRHRRREQVPLHHVQQRELAVQWPTVDGLSNSTQVSKSGLCPFTDGYGGAAGRCTQNQPATVQNVTTDPGLPTTLTGNARIWTPSINLRVVSNTSTSSPTFTNGATVSVKATGGCTPTTGRRRATASPTLDDLHGNPPRARLPLRRLHDLRAADHQRDHAARIRRRLPVHDHDHGQRGGQQQRSRQLPDLEHRRIDPHTLSATSTPASGRTGSCP